MSEIPIAWRIAGGRRRYNAERRRARDARRARIMALMLADERPCVAPNRWGLATTLARSFGVHHSTIVRDLAAVRSVIALPDPCCRLHEQLDARLRPVQASYARILGYWPPLDELKRILRGEA